jgi:glycosyltransferase involved in cell wall biosynthesis
MSSTQRAKVLLLIPHLGGGGAEHIVETLAQHLSPRKYEMHLGLVTQSTQGTRNFPQLNAVHALGARRVRDGVWTLLWLVWMVRPAVILSGMAHLNLLVLALRPLFPSRTRVIVRQNGTLSAILAPWGNSRLSRCIYAAAYGRADMVICQTRQMAEELQAELGLDNAKLVVLRNPVGVPEIRLPTGPTKNAITSAGPRLVAVARLAPEKGIDLLLEAFAEVSRRFPRADLEIAGSGSCQPALKEQCRTLGIEGHVRFLGNVAEPASLLRDASLFVLSSRVEAMPNALLEAAAAGLPIVALPASPGLVELLSGQPGVWLGREISAQALEACLCIALSSIHAGQRFPHSWLEPFDRKNAIPAYEDVIDQALLERGT